MQVRKPSSLTICTSLHDLDLESRIGREGIEKDGKRCQQFDSYSTRRKNADKVTLILTILGKGK